ncbi:hypothetical protein RND81_13G087100 [Saponaria officinalis]|uniref:Uncharacterized protein n=1 Tax=Saponaria officinalis TaxID=3572 RepID=A0AAW1H558_SAPOF
MAIKTNTGDSSACSSPRISFSCDLPQTGSPETRNEVEVYRLDRSLLSDVNFDFNFCVSEKESYCPADELFFNGMIIPTQMKQKLNSINGKSNMEEDEEEEITALTTATLIREEKTRSKSIWRFNRSSSLNYDNNKKSSIWSLPSLFRSKSTGSSSAYSSNDNSKQTQKSSKLLSSPSTKRSHQKPPLKKSGSNGGGFGRSYPINSGGRNSYALNVQSPYIAKGASDLLGFSTLFRNGSVDKKGKK